MDEKNMTEKQGRFECSDQRNHDAAWAKFRAYCANDLKFGEIKLQIQNGIPVLAEYVKKRIKFT
jgi:hypothetical protein